MALQLSRNVLRCDLLGWAHLTPKTNALLQHLPWPRMLLLLLLLSLLSLRHCFALFLEALLRYLDCLALS